MVTVSIVVHNTPASQLKKAIKCLNSSYIGKIYVIDNSPGEELKDSIAIFKNVRYCHVENKGFGAGHNVALKKMIKENPDGYHLVMNADIWWDGDIINPLVNYMKSNPDIGMISPKVFYPNGDLQYTCRMLPTPLDLFIKRFLPQRISAKRMGKYLLTDHDHDKKLNCPYLLGSFLFFRVKALENAGIFDERFFMYPEDIDITRRIHEGWQTLYWPKVSIIHEHQAASRKSFKMLWIHLLNMIKYFNKWGWFFDRKRKIFNERLRNSINYIPEEQRPLGRG